MHDRKETATNRPVATPELERDLAPVVDGTSSPLKDAEPTTNPEEGTAPPGEMPTEGTPLPAFWAAIKRMPRYARLSAGLARDGQVPRRAKAALAGGGAYAFSPIDLVPGVIPVAGQLDDLFVVMTAVQYAVNASPPEVAAEHLERAGLTREDLDSDMAAVRATIRWLVQRGAKTGGNLASAGLRKAQALWRRRG